MRPRYLIPALCSAAALVAQDPLIRVPVRVVSLPTAVLTRDGHFVRNFQPWEFHLSDNDRDQNIGVDTVDESLSLAVVVQTSEAVRGWLPHIRRVASVVQALVVGQGGEAAVITFADEVIFRTHLTAETKSMDVAFTGLTPRGHGAAVLDAVMAAAGELKNTPAERRRVILRVAQAGDSGSRTELRAVLDELHCNNISLYSMVMPRAGKQLVADTIAVRDARSASGRADTGIVGSVDVGKLLPEIFRGVKAAAGEDAVTVMTAAMGGRRIPFRRLRELEDGISVIGEELHTEYVLSYGPTGSEPGFHRILVRVERPDMVVRSRPGYYVAR